MGAEHAFLPGEARDGEYDVVIEASGAVPALLEALRVADVGGGSPRSACRATRCRPSTPPSWCCAA